MEIQEFERNGNFQDYIEDENTESEPATRQKLSNPDPATTKTRFASFIGEQRLLTEADLA